MTRGYDPLEILSFIVENEDTGVNVLSLPQVVRGFVQRETKNIAYFDQSWSRRLWLYRNGFTSSRGVIYDISSKNVDDFLSDTDWLATQTINQPYDDGLKVKPLFHRLVSNTHRELLPTAYGILHDGREETLDSAKRSTLSTICVHSYPLVGSLSNRSMGSRAMGFTSSRTTITVRRLTERS